jgi:hypothetical protein
MKCTHCGASDLEPGFIEDDGEHSRGYARWIAGPLQRGPLGGARRLGKKRAPIDAFRCLGCGHLELFVSPPV